MNFPMGSPLFQFLFWFVNTPGVGSAMVVLLLLSAVAFFVTTLRWIIKAPDFQGK